MGADAETDRHRGGRAVVRRVVAGVLERRDAAAHLLRAAVPRRRVHRAGDLRLALLRAGLPPRTRATAASSSRSIAPAQLIGLLLTTRIITRLFVRSATLVPRFVAGRRASRSRSRGPRSRSARTSSIAVILNALVTGIVVLIVPPIFAALSLAIPPKIRSFGFAVAALWILPGPGPPARRRRARRRVGHPHRPDPHGPGLPDRRAGRRLGRARRSRRTSSGCGPSAAAQSEVLYERRQGRAKLLLVRGVVGPLRRGAGAVRRRPRGRRGRDRRAARHQRRRASRRCSRRSPGSSSRPRARSSSTAAT